MTRFKVFILILPFVLFSCDNTVENLNPNGISVATITGDVSFPFNGVANFLNIGSTDSAAGKFLSSLEVSLVNNTPENEIIYIKFSSDAIGTGVGPGIFSASMMGNANLTFDVELITETGTYTIDKTAIVENINRMEITSVKDLEVRGTFEFNLTHTATDEKVKLVGSFMAVGETLIN